LKKPVFFYITAVLSVVYGCAKVGSPTGGSKDVTPPKIIESKPVNYSTDFNSKKIEITFDEYIQLKNIQQELLISPPLKEIPENKLRGKSLVVDLNNELKENTTYTLNFGNAITDNNEGNVLANYEFVFSTGDHVDSMSVTGKLINAFNLKPEEDPVFIMLYENLADSAPYIDIPSFIGKTNKDGSFAVNNIKADTLRIFSLKDANSNLLFDASNEKIAFIDSSFILSPELIETTLYYLADSLLPADSIDEDLKLRGFVIDSISGDTVKVEEKLKYALHVNLYLFQEENIYQYLTTKERETREKLVFEFKRPLYDSLEIVPLNFTRGNEWFIKEKSAASDTIVYWIKDSLIINTDTLSLQLKYTVVDTLNNFVTQVDTVNLRYRELRQKKPASRKSKEDEDTGDKDNYLDLSLNIAPRATVDLNKTIWISTGKPVASFDPSLIKLYKLEDTLEINQPFTFIKDTAKLRKFKMTTVWEERMNYKLLIEPGAFTDIYGLSNDTVLIKFPTQKADYYGALILTAEDVVSPLIIQLLNENESLVREKYISQNSIIRFDYLEPKKYMLKIIYDDNDNRKWDTGNYLKKIQPEKVKYYSGEINVRSNWDVEIVWKLGG
jgi:hypothetical protein